MSGLNNLASPIPTPDLRTVLDAHKNEVLSVINCAQVGTVQSFDASKQTATIAINAKRVVYNQSQPSNGTLETTPTIVDYPALVDCPVFVLCGGDGALTMPVKAGDTCLVLFLDRDIDNWFTTGASMPPNSGRMHDLSDAVALVGIRPSTNPHGSYPTDATKLVYKDSRVQVKEGGGSVGVDADVQAHSANGGQVNITDLIEVKNAVTDLRTVLNLCVTALTTLNSLKTGGSAATQITAFSTALPTLLK